MDATPDRSGFTLLEMLMAMTLMAVLAGSLYASLSIGFRGRRVTEEALEPARRAAAALATLGADLRGAVPPTGLLAAEFLGEDAQGGGGEHADVLLFHALAKDQSDAEPPCPVRRIEFALRTDEGDDEVVLVRRTTVNLLAPEEREPIEEVLCRRVRSLDTAFFDGTAWSESWDSTLAGDALPLAVEVSLVLDVEGREEGYALSRVFALPCGEAPEAGAMGMRAQGAGP